MNPCECLPCWEIRYITGGRVTYLLFSVCSDLRRSEGRLSSQPQTGGERVSPAGIGPSQQLHAALWVEPLSQGAL